MRKIKSTIPGLVDFPEREKIYSTPHSFLEARRKIDGAEGLWRVGDNLYDLKDFVKQHPGGAEWLNLTKGTDITELFETHHMTDKPSSLLPKYFVRKANSPRNIPLTFNKNGFYQTLKRRVLEALKNVDFHNPSSKSNRIADSLFIGTVFFCLATAYTQNYLFIVPAAIFLGWCTICAHNYIHMKDNFRMYYFDLSVMSSKEWRISHAISHHIYPNTIWDYEMYSIEPYLEWIPYSKKSTLKGLISQIMSPVIWATLMFDQGIKRYYSVFYEYKKFEFRDAVPFFLPLMMCFFAPNPLVALKFWFFIILSGSFVFGMIGFNAAHHHPDIFHDGDVYDRKELDWGLLELDAIREREVIDDSDFLVLTFFGQHSLHHLLPTIDHCYLSLCNKAFMETCKEFGVNTKRFTPWDHVKGQFRQILRKETKRNIR